MYLKSIYLNNFRCHKESFFEFCPGINTIYGPNARGKTTVLEAIHLLITGRSFRTSQISDLIGIGAPGFYLEANFIKHGIEQQIKFSCNGKEKSIYHNSTPCTSIASLLGLLQGVVITPDDASLVKGSPNIRRHFLDLQIAQTDPLYVHHLGRYNRAMRQRNTLLRAKSGTTINSWEHEMANSAAYLVQQRQKAIHELQNSSRGLHKALSGETEELELIYKTGLTSSAGMELPLLKQFYMDQYHKLRYREMLLGSTLTGPHKDDLTISIGQKEVRFFASEGQQRSCVAALRLAEWERLNMLANEPPLMLIDDVGVSLDSIRRDRLLNQVQYLGQVFLTATQELILPESSTKEVRVIELRDAIK